MPLRHVQPQRRLANLSTSAQASHWCVSPIVWTWKRWAYKHKRKSLNHVTAISIVFFSVVFVPDVYEYAWKLVFCMSRTLWYFWARGKYLAKFEQGCLICVSRVLFRVSRAPNLICVSGLICISTDTCTRYCKYKKPIVNKGLFQEKKVYSRPIGIDHVDTAPDYEDPETRNVSRLFRGDGTGLE